MARNPLKRAGAAALAAGLALSLSAAPAAYAKTSSSSTKYVEGVVMSRLYNPYTGEHLYTSSDAEVSNLVAAGWNDEGDGWVAPKKSKSEVYRLYNPYAPGGDHHYTTNWGEVENLKAAGWRYEGVGWYSADSESVPLYRQYNPNASTGTHNYTSSEVEKDSLVSSGWNDEDVAWYGLKSVQVKTDEVWEDQPVYEEKEVTEPATSYEATIKGCDISNARDGTDGVDIIAYCDEEWHEYLDFVKANNTTGNRSNDTPWNTGGTDVDVVVLVPEKTYTEKVQVGTQKVKVRDVYETRYV